MHSNKGQWQWALLRPEEEAFWGWILAHLKSSDKIKIKAMLIPKLQIKRVKKMEKEEGILLFLWEQKEA